MQENIGSSTKPASSTYIKEERREYSLYVLTSRAVPHVADGLKAAARRCLWVARDGKKYKTATLAGAVMPLHPHAPPTGAIESLTGPYINNIPLFDGEGAFGTLLNPRSAMAAPRYTSVKVSEFTKDVVFRDIEIIPLQENYDGTLEEPKHFLPLIPIVLLNPQEGIAVGFASTILPRSLSSIIDSMISVLENREFVHCVPTFTPTGQVATHTKDNKYDFIGQYEVVDSTTIKITNLPYGMTHENYIERLIQLEEKGSIVSFIDNSRDCYEILVKFKRGELANQDPIETLNLRVSVTENLNVIDFDGERVWTTNYEELIQHFCAWRLQWYVARYQRLADLLTIDIQRLRDILTAITFNVGGLVKTVASKQQLKSYLSTINIIHIDYIAELPLYRFTKHEKDLVEAKLKTYESQLAKYHELLNSPIKRRKQYIKELKEIQLKYCN